VVISDLPEKDDIFKYLPSKDFTQQATPSIILGKNRVPKTNSTTVIRDDPIFILYEEHKEKKNDFFGL